GAVGHPDLARLVREQREGKGELLREGRILGDGIEGDPENLRIGVLEVSVEVAEPATFLRSTGCVGLRLEPEENVLASVVGETAGLSGVVHTLEVGSRIAGFQHEPPRSFRGQSYSNSCESSPRASSTSRTR